MDLSVSFTDFWAGFNEKDNFFTKILSHKYNVYVVKPNENPDLLICSYFGFEHMKYDCLKLYFTGENNVPDFNFFDYALSFHFIDFGDRYMRLPLYLTYPCFETLRSNSYPAPQNAYQRNFCSFVVSNDFNGNSTRLKFFKMLSEIAPVASGGRCLNNIGGPVKDKDAFIRKYKFNIAFENSMVEGYTTEKLFDAFAAKTVPIYWGNPLVSRDANPEAFINITDFATLQDAVDYVAKVNSDEKLYHNYLNSNPIADTVYMNWEEMLLQFMDNIIQSRKRYTTKCGIMGDIQYLSLIKERLFSYPKLRNNLELIDKISNFKKKIKL